MAASQQRHDTCSTSAAATCSSGTSSEGRRCPTEENRDRTCKRPRFEDESMPSTSGANVADSKAASKQPRYGGKQRLLWTTHLHTKFIEAVKLLGLEHAVPTKILELMDEPGVTREQVASHLQKHRMHLKRVAGQPADVPADHQPNGLLHATQLPLCPSMHDPMTSATYAALPLAPPPLSCLPSQSLLYHLPHGLGPYGAMQGHPQGMQGHPQRMQGRLQGMQAVQMFDASTAVAYQQPSLHSLQPLQSVQVYSGSQVMALNLLPVSYNPYGLLALPNVQYACVPMEYHGHSMVEVAGDATGLDAEDMERGGGGQQRRASGCLEVEWPRVC
jgi:SHAQKYF class myb-like DNA-binding protein